jgi:hypothetical protein
MAAGCATAPTDISFGTETASLDAAEGVTTTQNDAMLLLAVGPIGTGGGFWFQRLNEDKTDFGAKPVALGYGTWGVGDKMQRPKDDKSNLWVLDQKEINFLIKKVEPGFYAATYLTWNTYNGVSSGTAWNCLDQGAYIFEIKANEINIVSSRDAFPRGTMTRLSTQTSDEDIVEQFSRTRLNYPDLKGDPVLAPPVFEARWTEKDGGFFGADCQGAEPDTFTLSRIGSDDPDAAPDADEAAAIAAALENLKKSKDIALTGTEE